MQTKFNLSNVPHSLRSILTGLMAAILLGAPVTVIADCKAFITYGDEQGMPPQVECKGKSKDIKSCLKICVAQAKKGCPKGAESFGVQANYNGSDGFAAESVDGKCKK